MIIAKSKPPFDFLSWLLHNEQRTRQMIAAKRTRLGYTSRLDQDAVLSGDVTKHPGHEGIGWSRCVVGILTV